MKLLLSICVILWFILSFSVLYNIRERIKAEGDEAAPIQVGGPLILMALIGLLGYAAALDRATEENSKTSGKGG